jgi:hypothetical protein
MVAGSCKLISDAIHKFSVRSRGNVKQLGCCVDKRGKSSKDKLS